MNVLITCCLGDHIRSNVKHIKQAYPDCKIVGVDMREMHSNRNMIDRFYRVGRCDSPEYKNEILQICQFEQIDVILSFSSLDIKPFKEILDQLHSMNVNVALGLDKKNCTEAANDKLLFSQMCQMFGVKIAKTSRFLINDTRQLCDLMWDNCIRKVVVKEIDSTGAKGMQVFTYEDLAPASNMKFEKKVIAQEFLGGDEYSVDCFCKNGEVLFSAVKRNYEMDLGVSIYSEIVDRPDIAKMCEDACKAFCLDGLVGFDLKADNNGNVFIIECNPRPTATISLIAEGGVNLMKHLIEYYTTGDTDFSTEKLDYGLKILRYREDYFFKGDLEWKMQ